MNDETEVDVTVGREGFIGASDEPAVQNVGIYEGQNPWTLWGVKRGIVPPPQENAPMKWGHLLQPVVREATQWVTGRSYRNAPRFVHPQHAFIVAHPDGISADGVLYEGKTARTAEGWGEQGTDEIPMHVTLQVQHQLMCAGLAGADVAVLIGGSDHRVYEVPADAEIQEMLIVGCIKFWKYVESGERPPLDYSAPGALAFIKRLYPGTSGEIVKVIPPEIQGARFFYEQAKADEKTARELADAKMAEMLDYMRDAALLEFEDGKALRRMEVSRKEYVVKATKWMDARFVNTRGNK